MKVYVVMEVFNSVAVGMGICSSYEVAEELMHFLPLEDELGIPRKYKIQEVEVIESIEIPVSN